MIDIDVVIISWAKDNELLQITHEGLDSLFTSESNEDVTFHAYIVESNPVVNYDHYNQTYRRHTVTTIYTNESFGYHKYLNLGVKAGTSPYVVLCNSDLTYENHWATNILAEMELNPNLLSASPWCPQTQGDNITHIGNIYNGYGVRTELAGWCIFQQRKIYDIINELDEQFTFWYCDNDYAMELQKHNILHALIPTSVVNHHDGNIGKTGRILSDEDQAKLTHAQVEVFNRKWY
jgi:GT2 family glycosyltransferase